MEQGERGGAGALRVREQVATSNEGLAEWLRGHRYLLAAELESGESGMALLLLWEVDHGRPFPRQGGSGPSAALTGFTRRLKAKVEADAELSGWLQCKYMQRPLAPGLPASHHSRWSVRVVRPREQTYAYRPGEGEGVHMWVHVPAQAVQGFPLIRRRGPQM